MSNKTLNALITLLLLVLAYSINNRRANVTEVHQTVVITQMEMDILNRLNAPEESIRIIIAWEKAEGADLNCNNPLNTSLDAPGAKTINSHGVKCYPDYNTGIEATITTLLAPEYMSIVAAIQQHDEEAFVIALGNSRWGTDANFVKRILEENTTYITEEIDMPTPITAYTAPAQYLEGCLGANIRSAHNSSPGLRSVIIPPGSDWSFNENWIIDENTLLQCGVYGGGVCNQAARWSNVARNIGLNVYSMYHGYDYDTAIPSEDNIEIWSEGKGRGGQDLIITNNTAHTAHFIAVIEQGYYTVHGWLE